MHYILISTKILWEKKKYILNVCYVSKHFNISKGKCMCQFVDIMDFVLGKEVLITGR